MDNGVMIINTDTFVGEVGIDFLESISDVPVIVKSMELLYEKGKEMHRGFLTFHYTYIKNNLGDIALHIFAKSDIQMLNKMLPIFLKKVIATFPTKIVGYIVLVNCELLDFTDRSVSSNFERMLGQKATKGWYNVEFAKKDIEVLEKVLTNPFYIIAATGFDKPNALPIENLREALNIPPTVRVVPCDPTNHQSVKTVLLELLSTLEKSDVVEQTREILQRL